MWCVDLFNSVYVQWNLCYNCKFTKFDTKLNVQIPVEFRSKVLTGTKMLFRYRNRNSGRSMIATESSQTNRLLRVFHSCYFHYSNEVVITLWWFRSPVYGITTIVLANGSNAQMYGIITSVRNHHHCIIGSYARVINK